MIPARAGLLPAAPAFLAVVTVQGERHRTDAGACNAWGNQCQDLGILAGATGLEPATSGVTGRRSNQLSYAPAAIVSAAAPWYPAAPGVSSRPPAWKMPMRRGLAARLRALAPLRDAGRRARGRRASLSAATSAHARHRWWAMRDSNPRPPRCKRD